MKNVIIYPILISLFVIVLVSLLLHRFAPQYLRQNTNVRLTETRSIRIHFGKIFFMALIT